MGVTGSVFAHRAVCWRIRVLPTTSDGLFLSSFRNGTCMFHTYSFTFLNVRWTLYKTSSWAWPAQIRKTHTHKKTLAAPTLSYSLKFSSVLSRSPISAPPRSLAVVAHSMADPETSGKKGSCSLWCLFQCHQRHAVHHDWSGHQKE